MTLLAKYRYSLGVPGYGFHEHRMAGLARNDVVGTFILAAIVAHLFRISYLRALIEMVVAGTLLHFVFAVDTALLRYLNIM